MDSFSAHKTDIVKQRFCEKKTDLAVIPGGLTSRLQPLDVSLNRSFKAKVINSLVINSLKQLFKLNNLN